MSFRSHSGAFWEGVRNLLPMVSGVLPFGLIAGANGVAMGFSPEMILGMTVLFFAGSAQLVAYQLIQDQVAPLVILLTTLLVNIRFAIYSAAFAPLLHPLPRRYRWPLAYLLSDQAYGLCATPTRREQSVATQIAFYTGVALSMWCCWTLSVMAGVVIGSRIPPEWSLEFAIPLAFLAMLVGTLSNQTMLLVALVSGGCSILFLSLPLNAGFIVAVIAGVLAGLCSSSIFSEGLRRGNIK